MNPRATFRAGLIAMAFAWLTLFSGCGRSPESHYEIGFTDGKRLGKERQMMSSSYFPPEARAWTETQRHEYRNGFRAGNAAQLTAQMRAQGITFAKPPHYIDGIRAGLKFGTDKGVHDFQMISAEMLLPPDATGWTAAEKSFYQRGFRDAIFSPKTAQALLVTAK